MPKEKISEILEKIGWVIECESPVEIRHSESGSFANGDIAKEIILDLKNTIFNSTLYKHFKGGLYYYLFEASFACCHEDYDSIDVVIYEDIRTEKRWVRPRNEFFGMVVDNGEEKRRFEKICEYNHDL